MSFKALLWAAGGGGDFSLTSHGWVQEPFAHQDVLKNKPGSKYLVDNMHQPTQGTPDDRTQHAELGTLQNWDQTINTL